MSKKTPVIKWPVSSQSATRYVGCDGNAISIVPYVLTDLTGDAQAYDPETNAQVAGSFVQSPPAGTELDASIDVSVAFTPTDTTNYSNTTASRKLTIRFNDSDRCGKIKFDIPLKDREATIRILCDKSEVNYIPYILDDFAAASKVETIDCTTVPGTLTQSPPAGTEVFEDTEVTLTFKLSDPSQWAVESTSVTKKIRIIRIKRDVCPVIDWESREESGQSETWNLNPVEEFPHIVGSRGETDARALDPETGEVIGGTFIYDPPDGTIKRRSFDLKASFTPGNAAFYDSTSRTISMQVEEFEKNPDPPLTVFGCYVENFSSSASFGAQGGSLQMTLVEDEETGRVFTPPPVGTACYFQYGEFYFGGVFQRYTYNEAISGRKYDIILESPGGKILNGVNVILADFDGGTWAHDGSLINFGFGDTTALDNQYGENFDNSEGLRNILNPLAYWENYTEGGDHNPSYGDAETNSAGFPVRKLLDTVELLTRGESVFGDKIFFGESEYEIDFTEIKVVPQHFRISNQVTTITNIIEECCEILQFSYVLDVLGEGELSTDVEGEAMYTIANPTIKVKVIDRSAQPELGRVQELIDEEKGNELVSHSVGQELSDEAVQQMIVGGPASRYVLGDVVGMVPVWGKTVDGKWLLQTDLDGCPAAMPGAYGVLQPVPIQVTQDASAFYYTATIDELRMATAGRATWTAFKVFESVKRGTYDIDPWVADLEVTEEIINLMAQGSVGTLALSSTSLKLAKLAYNLEEQQFRDRRVDAIFEAVSKCANNFYGRVFLAQVPEEPGGFDNNIKFKNERPQDQYTSISDQVSSWAPTSSAWVEERPINDLNFYDETGKLKSAAIWSANALYDYNQLGTNYGFYNDGINVGVAGSNAGYINGDEFVYWTDFRNVGGGNCAFDPENNGLPCVVVDAGAQVKSVDQWTGKRMGLIYFAYKFFNIELSEENLLGFSTQLANIEIPPRIEEPLAFGMPQISNRYSWGPWYSFNVNNGRSEMSFDTNLAPENFGSISKMDEMGAAYVESTLAEVTQHETGTIRLARKPEFNITDRLAGSGPYITDINCNVDPNGIYTDYSFNTWTPKFGKLAKYNADRLSRIYKDTIRALKFLRGQLQKPPIITFANRLLRFLNDDRLKRNRGTGTAIGFTQRARVGPIGPFPVAARTFEGSVSDLNDAFATSYNALATDPWEQYKRSFSISQEQMFSPYQASKIKAADTDEVPKIEAEETSGEDGDFTGGNVLPTAEELDPYFPNNLYQDNDDGSVFISRVDYHSVVNETEDSGDLTEDLQIKKLEDPTQLKKVRSVGIRGPAVMSGWGYDLANNPVPFEPANPTAEPPTSEDITVFQQEASDDRTKWETGPVKLMWDKERKVWAGGHDILVGILKTDITAPTDPFNPTTFEFEVLRKVNTPKGNDALELKGETLTGYNRDPSLSVVAGPDAFLMVQRINYEWVPMKGGGESDAHLIFFQTDGYVDIPEAQIIYVRITRVGCTGGGTTAPSENPHDHPGFPANAELIYMGYSYDIQSGGDSYLSYFWMYKVCDSNFDAIVWVDDQGSNDMAEWVDNLPEQNGGNCDWLINLADDVGRVSAEIGIVDATIDALAMQPAAYEVVDLIKRYPDEIDLDDCDVNNRCENLPTPESNKEIEVSIIARQCPFKEVPGEVNGKVKVVDLMDAFLYGRTEEDIRGRKGVAAYVKNDGEYECYWAIVFMDMFDTITMVSDIIFGSRGITIERKRVDIWFHCDLTDEYIEGKTCEDSG